MKINKLLTTALLINSTAIYAGLNDTGIITCSNATQNGIFCSISSLTVPKDKSKDVKCGKLS